MKKFFFGILSAVGILFTLSGCAAVGEKATSLSIIYGAAAVISLALLVAVFFLVRKKRTWIVLLFSSVLVVNMGYTFLALSSSLEVALQANRVAYLGSVFLPLSMLMMILELTNTRICKWLTGALFGISAVMFCIAASPGILPIYYKEVSFAVVDGVSTLVKVYGPLHPLYLVYLLGYFAAMVVVIIRAQVKKTIDTTTHAVVVAVAVFVNIGVWFIEQIAAIGFEMLSISYIISELFLLGVRLVINENQRLQQIVKQVETVHSYMGEEKPEPIAMREKPLSDEVLQPERIDAFVAGLQRLTPTEREIYDAYIARATTKEVMANLNIKETTLKYHNSNLYGKLGVSSRKELLELHKQIKAVKVKLQEADNSTGKQTANNP